MFATGPGDVTPPAITAPFVAVPLEPICLLAVFMSALSVQLVPFQVSVKATYSPAGTLFGPEYPPEFIASVDVPDPALAYRPIFKLLTSVQLVPFQDSVKAI